jgi:hypothetical protein
MNTQRGHGLFPIESDSTTDEIGIETVTQRRLIPIVVFEIRISIRWLHSYLPFLRLPLFPQSSADLTIVIRLVCRWAKNSMTVHECKGVPH